MSLSVAPPSPSRPRPDWLPAVAALSLVGLTVWLGAWQLDRANEKLARQVAYDAATASPALDIAALPAAALPYQRVRVSGRFDNAYRVYLDNRMSHGRPGYQLIVPLLYPGGVVLVNRGWLPAGGDRATPVQAPTTAAPVTLEGLLVPAQSRYLELSRQDVAGPVWQNLSLARYRAWYRGDLPDRMLLQTSPASDGLVRDWPRPDTGVERHRGYAAQWFALATTILALYVYYGRKLRCHAPR